MVQVMQSTGLKTGALRLLSRLVVACSEALVYQALGSSPVPSATTEPSPKERPQPLTAERFEKLCQLIRPQPGELRFHEIPWLLDVWEARKKAAEEGKPILAWSGAGGAPLGVC
jgi:hypothetical protein